MSAGAGLSAFGAINQGNSEANMSNYNAQVAGQSAQQALDQGAEQEQIANVQAAKTIGSATAAYGASGVSAGSGSALDVLRNSAANATLNSLNIQNQAEIKATSYENEAALDSYRASNDATSGYLKAASSLLSSGSSGGGGSPDSSSGADASGAEADAGEMAMGE